MARSIYDGFRYNSLPSCTVGNDNPGWFVFFVPNNIGNKTCINKLNTGSLILAGDYMIYPTFEAAADSGEIAAERVMEYLDK